MTKLSERVKKAKKLRFTPTGAVGQFNTWGSKDDHYIVTLKSSKKEVVTPDGYLTIKVFETNCQKQNYSHDMKRNNPCNCKGNIAHTICYHCLGAAWWSFKQADKADKKISFYETYQDADRALAFGGFIAEVVNQNGKGNCWAVVRGSKIEKATPKILPSEVNIELLRGNIEDEGID